ncbi:AI-2E family transporter [bacterium]|nr:AI-2E family transporter [bacterium]
MPTKDVAKRESNKITIDFTWWGIFRVFLVLIGIYTVYVVHDSLMMIILGLVISVLLNPFVDFLEKKKIHRSFATIFVYLGAVAVISLFIFLTIPPIFNELLSFAQNYSNYFSKIEPIISDYTAGLSTTNFLASGLQEGVLKITSELWIIGMAIANGVFSVVTIFTFAFFFSIEEKEILDFIKLFSPKKLEGSIIQSWNKSRAMVSYWFGARILSSTAVAIMSFIGCLILGLKFSVSISLLAGLLNIVPVAGPIFAGILFFGVGILESWQTAVLAVIMFTIVQQIENNFLTPLITKKLIGLPNFLILGSILIGGQIAGVIGMFLAIPAGGIIYETAKNYVLAKKNKERY